MTNTVYFVISLLSLLHVRLHEEYYKYKQTVTNLEDTNRRMEDPKGALP